MIRSIFVPLDGSQLAERILPAAAVLAGAAGAQITLAHVLEPKARPTVHSQRHLTGPEEAEAYLASLAGQMPAGLGAETQVIRTDTSDVARAIVQNADQAGADVIAMTTHGAGDIRRMLFGSIAQQTLALCSQSVLLCPSSYPAGQAFQCRRILLPVDIAPGHEAGLRFGIELARATGAAVHLVTVAPTYSTLPAPRASAAQVLPATSSFLLDIEAEQMRRHLVQCTQQAAEAGLEFTADFLEGEPAQRLLELIKRSAPDMVVFSTHRRKGLDAFFQGSIGSRLCNASATHLFIIPLPAE